MSRLAIGVAAGGLILVVGLVVWGAVESARQTAGAAEAAPDGGDEQITREIAWAGAQTLDIEAPSEVTFTQGPVPRITVTGAKRDVDRIRVEGGRIEMEPRHARRRAGFFQISYTVNRPMRIAVTAPDVRTFNLQSAGKLRIDDFSGERLDLNLGGFGSVDARTDVDELNIKLDGSGDVRTSGRADVLRVDLGGFGDVVTDTQSRELEVDIRGSGDVRASGRADRADISIDGFGDADLFRLEVKDAIVRIAGAGGATLGPSRSADVSIAGFGDVSLLSDPPQLTTRTSGAGKVRRWSGASRPEQRP